MNKLQYDDFYTEWIDSQDLECFLDIEEEEYYSRANRYYGDEI